MGTTSDKAVLTRKLGAADYNPSKYVAEISQRCVGGEEILGQRRMIQELSEDTNTLLKQNVYQNYKQFIETAQEISHLENDMYRLSSMITEQRRFLSGLLENSILGDAVPLTHTLDQEEAEPEPEPAPGNRQESGRQLLVELMEGVEGGRDIIDIPTRFLLYDGDLIEMDTNEHSAIHRVHIYLTNDSIIIATWLREKRGPVRFKLSSQYALSSCAMVNVRDLAGISNAWKLLVTPEPRLFQCKDAQSKKEWLSAYEEAKEWQRTGGKPQKEKKEPKKMALNPSSNPFSESERYAEPMKEVKPAPVIPDWLQELADTLDVHIAQREFEAAMEIIVEAEAALADLEDCEAVREVKEANTTRKDALIQVLRGELKLTPDKSMQGGPRTARRAVFLLSGLGRDSEAKDLFLAHRTALLRHNVRSCRAEGNTTQYIHRIGTTFFQQIAETSREYDKCFPVGGSTSSLLLMWLEEEVEWFAEIVDKQIFSTHAPLASIADSISRLRGQATKLLPLGLDVVFLLDNRLQAGIERIVCEARDKAVEAVKLRWGEETWLSHNAGSRSGLDKCLIDLKEAGIASAPSFLDEQGVLQLTTNSVSFGLSYLTLTDQLLLLFTPGTRHIVNESLVSVLHAQLRHLDQAVRSEKAEGVSKTFIMKNASFLLDTVLTLVEHKYQNRTGSDCPKLSKLDSNYAWLKEGKGPVTKYQDTNFV